MSQYLGEPDYDHSSPERLGILVTNLGTPNSPAPADVRRFLAEFLWDPRVVEAPRWLWWLALHGVILRIRPSKSAHAYRQIWTPEGSPLMIHSRAVADTLGKSTSLGAEAVVVLGMTYGNPSIANALRELKVKGARRILVLPLYPQYSGTTSASVFDAVTRELQTWRWVPEVRFVMSYADDPQYIEAIATSIRNRWSMEGQAHLLFSFHGIPKRYLLAGDPYHCQCQKTARLVTQALGLERSQWSLSFQSQVGREEWLKPYTDQLLVEYAKTGPKRLTVVCPGFATDCLETLEEIALRNRELFMRNGGEYYDYVPALNAGDLQIRLLDSIARRHIADWLADGHQAPNSDDLALRKARALEIGASR
jgi:protoporphyrin/coproporphyrin ferrochelatase